MEIKSPKTRFKTSQIEMAHGAGGKASRRLLEGLILPLLDNPTLNALGDAAHLSIGNAELAFTADSFVVHPLSFPGGSIGKLAVNGTVNDLAVSGAQPQALLSMLIVEAGLSSETIEAELEAMAAAANRAGVSIVGGDTKVVEHGKADGLYITTAGIGLRDPEVTLRSSSVQPGDQVLLSGPIGDHGITIMLARGELDLRSELTSDSRPVTPLVETLTDAAGPGLRWMRDPTRGGVATALNELVQRMGHDIVLFEEKLPVRRAVRGACEILGLDPLHIANEGQFLAVVAPNYAEAALSALQNLPGGQEAALIGEVRPASHGHLICQNAYGGSRVITMLIGDPLPRIC